MTAEPWQCPACKTWIRADVTEHRCDPGSGAAPAVLPAGGGGGGASSFREGTLTVTGGGGYSATTGSSTVTMTVDGRQLYEIVRREARHYQLRNGGMNLRVA